MDPSLQNTLIGALVAAIAAMAAWIKTTVARSNEKHEACETDRKSIHSAVGEMKADLAHMKGCPAEPCPAKEAIRRAASFSIAAK